jgi:hypothetical protein
MGAYFVPAERPGIDCSEALMCLHFARHIAKGNGRKETHFVLRREEDGRCTLAFWGEVFHFPRGWYGEHGEIDPRDAVNAFVYAMLEMHAPDLVSEFQPIK